MARFKFYQSDPAFLLPQRVGDLIPDDDISWIIMEVVDRIDVSIITQKYSNKGCDGFHPKLLLKLIFYGVATGNRSSRKIARLARKDIGGIMLCGGEKPSWRTVARFLKVNENEVKNLFLQVLQLCIALEMVSFGQFSLDGTKIKANAFKGGSIKAEVIQKRITELKTEIEQAIGEVKANDQSENAQYGESTPDELPKDISYKQKRLEKLEQALTELKARAEANGEKLQPDERYNFADPDSRLMKTSRNGYQQCYNHQAMVDEKERVIVAYNTSQDACDVELLPLMLEESKANTGQNPEAFIADKGYFSGKNLASIDSSIDAYICPVLEIGEYHKDKFFYDEEHDLYICPGNRKLTYRSTRKKRKDIIVRQYWGDCTGCSHRSGCIKSKTGKRTIERDQHDSLRENMRVKFQTDQAKEIFSHRKELSEPVFGQIKQQQNFQQHFRKGLKSCSSEFALACLIYNIKRIWHKYKDYQGTKNALENIDHKICIN